MGTHGAICIRSPSGKEIRCKEVTMCGSDLAGRFDEILEVIKRGYRRTVNDYIYEDSWGCGSEEILTLAVKKKSVLIANSGREFEQEYFVGVDYKTKTIYINDGMVGSLGIQHIVKIQKQLRKWRLEIGYDYDALIQDWPEWLLNQVRTHLVPGEISITHLYYYEEINLGEEQ